ncbi:MAG TPA: methylmalonyl-CoA epimerase [Gammaproteobacteria bacterium]|nr:methylmalonyl-CoA epimerase [Gammaproteobacteria bacterium]|tara:strand:+ start:2454 stop:2837 length:384 start_codon:yes stop_codon:yes gene_type:complete
MEFNRVHHTVVRVKDFDAGIETWRDKLGLELDRTTESEALGIKQAFFNLGDGSFIEVVAPTNDDSAVGKALARGEGIHTIAMEVEDLDATVAELEANGVQLIGVGGPQVFVHPKAANGILLQLTPKA